MDTLRRTVHYLANLEWTEKIQHDCKFCDESNFKSIIHQDDMLIVVDNIQSAGDAHWLIMPRSVTGFHLRDIEALTAKDIPLLQAMDRLKKELLDDHFPNINPSDIHCGYHRGRRPFLGSIFLPDIVSIHHFHLHIIVRPRPVLRYLKYPIWLPYMWLSDEAVMRKLRAKKALRSTTKSD